MALKRINKELTDLGRYVLPSSIERVPACLLVCQSAMRGPLTPTSRNMSTMDPRLIDRQLANFQCAVILPLPARLAPSEMTSYVTHTLSRPHARGYGGIAVPAAGTVWLEDSY